MFENQSMLRKLKNVLINWAIIFVSIIIFLPSVGLCEDVTLIAPIGDAKKIVVELEKGILYRQQVKLLEKANGQLLKQNQILNEQIELLNQQLALQKEQIELTTQQLEKQKELYEDKIKACEKNKTSFFDKVLIGLGGIGIGAILALVL